MKARPVLTTRELILAKLRAAEGRKLNRTQLSAALRYRGDARVTLRQLIDDGFVERHYSVERVGAKGRRPTMFALAKGKR